MDLSKGKSPFYPGHPVPPNFFSGRKEEIERIERNFGQVIHGRSPQAIFIQGEYGIGKSSLAGYARAVAEKKYNLFAIQVLMGGAATVNDVAERVLQSIITTESYKPTTTEKVRQWLSKYVGNQSLFGVTLKLDELKKDVPDLANGFLPFLLKVHEELQSEGMQGIVLILDELNGITRNPQFSYFIKNLVDQNALSSKPLPLSLILCGAGERRHEMINHHQPIDRIFEIIKMNPLNAEEMNDFFTHSFEAIGMGIEPEAMGVMCRYSGGYPKLMHIIGDNIFWIAQNGKVTLAEAEKGIWKSAQDIGEQFVEEQVLSALKSTDYKKILSKIAKGHLEMNFFKSQIEAGLTDSEKKKFTNFLHKMKKLNVLQSGEEKGEYVFQSRLTKLYIWMKASEDR